MNVLGEGDNLKKALLGDEWEQLSEKRQQLIWGNLVCQALCRPGGYSFSEAHSHAAKGILSPFYKQGTGSERVHFTKGNTAGKL